MFRAGLPGEFHQFVAVLTDEPFLVVAGNVVPDSSVPIEVVQHGHTCLIMLPFHPELSVVGLGLTVPPGLAPVAGHVSVPAAQPHVRPGPEPA